MREHNFQLSEWRPSTNPERENWECKQCDSIVSFPKGMNVRAVNRHMANRMLCLDPMFTPDKSTIVL
jgi:hypothetical protein